MKTAILLINLAKEGKKKLLLYRYADGPKEEVKKHIFYLDSFTIYMP